jgi:hypothetical protein
MRSSFLRIAIRYFLNLSPVLRRDAGRRKPKESFYFADVPGGSYLAFPNHQNTPSEPF